MLTRAEMRIVGLFNLSALTWGFILYMYTVPEYVFPTRLEAEMHAIRWFNYGMFHLIIHCGVFFYMYDDLKRFYEARLKTYIRMVANFAGDCIQFGWDFSYDLYTQMEKTAAEAQKARREPLAVSVTETHHLLILGPNTKLLIPLHTICGVVRMREKNVLKSNQTYLRIQTSRGSYETAKYVDESDNILQIACKTIQDLIQVHVSEEIRPRKCGYENL